MDSIRKWATVWAVLLIGLVVLLLAANSNPRPTQAQESATNLRARLELIKTAGKTATFEFARPITSGETILTLPADGLILSDVGDDYVCFAEPWNNGQRLHCTPFSNLVSVTYLDP